MSFLLLDGMRINVRAEAGISFHEVILVTEVFAEQKREIMWFSNSAVSQHLSTTSGLLGKKETSYFY